MPRHDRDQVVEAIHRYTMTGQGDVKKLTGRDGYRLRSGRYRIMFDEAV